MMSLLKLKSLFIGLFIAVFAVGGTVTAQDSFRIWKPYSDSFGGSRRSNDGMYSSLSGIYWSISSPTGGYIGATTAKGRDETRWVFDGIKEYSQTNSVKIDMTSPTKTLGTRFEVGNRRGNHGWLVSGYNLIGQTHTMNVENASMVIRDEGHLSQFITSGVMPEYGQAYVWDRQHHSLFDPTSTATQGLTFADWQQVIGGEATDLGYLWGFVNYSTEVTIINDDDEEETVETTVGVFVPLPIRFDTLDVNVRSSHMSGELMYTYRAHPFTWGSMELLAGARYWEFKDTFGLNGASFEDIEEGEEIDPLLNPRIGLIGMVVDAQGMNRVFGPQIGIKVNRQNARWTFGAEGRFTAGINAQMVKTAGSLTPRTGHPDESDPGAMWGAIGLINNNNTFGHKQNKAYFSPIGELRLSADWCWTESVSIFGALDGMFAGNIARGVRVTDYVVKSDGTIFGLRRDGRNENIAVYGAELGIKIRR